MSEEQGVFHPEEILAPLIDALAGTTLGRLGDLRVLLDEVRQTAPALEVSPEYERLDRIALEHGL